jgi:hypothetical protein
VYKGRVLGVYDDWEEYQRQVHHFSGNSYKEYTTRAEAEGRYTLSSRRGEGAEEEPDEDQFHRDDAHRDCISLLCDGSLDDLLYHVTTNSLLGLDILNFSNI